jgi:hypothetical protein
MREVFPLRASTTERGIANALLKTAHPTAIARTGVLSRGAIRHRTERDFALRRWRWWRAANAVCDDVRRLAGRRRNGEAGSVPATDLIAGIALAGTAFKRAIRGTRVDNTFTQLSTTEAIRNPTLTAVVIVGTISIVRVIGGVNKILALLGSLKGDKRLTCSDTRRKPTDIVAAVFSVRCRGNSVSNRAKKERGKSDDQAENKSHAAPRNATIT